MKVLFIISFFILGPLFKVELEGADALDSSLVPVAATNQTFELEEGILFSHIFLVHQLEEKY